MTQILRDSIFSRSTQFMAIYNSDTEQFLEFNESMKKRLGEAESLCEIKILGSNSECVYFTLSGVPCRMKRLVVIDRNIHIVELFPAHTKRWNQSSDIIRLTDLTSDGVWEWFPQVDFEYMSERFWDILGYIQKDQEESPRAWKDYIHPDDAKAAINTLEKHCTSRGVVPYHLRVRYTHRLGHEVFVLCRGCVVDWMPDGRPWRMLGTHTDVTTIVKKDAVEAQSKFISRMSHEIRSPICTILNECELFEDNDDVNTKTIMDTCHHLLKLTDDILSLGESGVDDLRLVQEEVNTQSFFVSCNKRHRLAARKKGVRLRLMTGDLPETILMDTAKCNQVLDNLINNSIKYSTGGVITLDINYDDDDEVCEVRVEDEGCGIPKSMFSKVFEEFVQGDKTMQGAGIGLTLCRRLSNAMGGNVEVEKSVEGEGTTMLFTMRLSRGNKKTSNVTLDGEVRIMVVDDMATNREILTKRLEFIGSVGLKYTVVEAVDGQDATEKFISSGGNFQLILMDCLMPVVDGFEATTLIHDECSRLKIEPVPVVAVTASVSCDIREKCLKHGMKYVVTKPYTREELLLSIKACMPSF